MRLRVAGVVMAVLVLGAWSCQVPTDSPGSAGSADVPISTTGLTSLVAGEAWHYVGAASEPAFQNSWDNEGGGLTALAFRIRESGIVDIQGVVSGGTANTTIFTLPAGYRPNVQVYVPVNESLISPTASRLEITSSGNVRATPGTGVVVIYAQMFLNSPALAP